MYPRRLSASHITFELYERTSSEEGGKKGFSLSIAISEGAHSPAILDSSVDARHSLNVQARKKFLSCVFRVRLEKRGGSRVY